MKKNRLNLNKFKLYIINKKSFKITHVINYKMY